MYQAYRPDGRDSLIDLARMLATPVICHRHDLESLRSAGIAVRVFERGGPLVGELWVELAEELAR